jgi:predicted nuclease of predicted toxin-antitoxin system
MTAFLANENISGSTVRVLRAEGHDVKWICEDSPSIKDEVVLMQAAAERRIVITYDSDYGELIFRRGASRPLGVIFLRLHSTDASEAAELILRFLAISDTIFENRFCVLSSDGTIRYKAL